MKKFLNYLGQLRLYSLVDLIVLIVALKPTSQEFIGIVLLHIGFLAYLETRHSHSYRNKLPQWLWVLLVITGSVFYRHWEIMPFLLVSYLYTKKTNGYYACFSPVFRSLQYLFLVAGIVGYLHPLVWISFVAVFIRNAAGDFRDVTKDIREGLKTIPIVIGMKKNIKYLHLITIILTTFIWWNFTTLSIVILCLVVMIEIATYKLTPR